MDTRTVEIVREQKTPVRLSNDEMMEVVAAMRWCGHFNPQSPNTLALATRIEDDWWEAFHQQCEEVRESETSYGVRNDGKLDRRTTLGRRAAS